MRLLLICACLLFLVHCESESQSRGIFTISKVGFNIDQLDNQVLIWDLTDASSLTIDGSNNVQQVTDKSGNGNHLIPASSGVRPAYLSYGGSNNLPYMTSASGKTTFRVGLSFNSTPLTMYAVIKLPSIPSDGQNINVVGATGGTDGILRIVSTSSGDGWRLYNGVTFSKINSQLSRADWVLVKTVYKDSDSMWMEVNDEPVTTVQQDGTGTTIQTIFDRYGWNTFNGVSISECRIFSGVVDATKDQRIKDYFISKYSIGRAAGKKNVIILGDSHSAGVMSGTATLGPYNVRMQTSLNYAMMTDATSGTAVVVTNGAINQLTQKYILYNKAKWNDFNVIFNYGTNDATFRDTGGGGTGPTRSVWISTYKAYLQTFIDAGFSRSKLILVTPPYSTSTVLRSNFPTINQQVHDDIVQICSDMGLTLCDWYNAMITANQNIETIPGTDHIHGDNAVHTTLYNTLTPLIQ